MEITRKSVLTGAVHTKDIDITQQQYSDYIDGALAQEAFPHLSAEDREFIISGATPEEWKELMEEEDAP